MLTASLQTYGSPYHHFTSSWVDGGKEVGNGQEMDTEQEQDTKQEQDAEQENFSRPRYHFAATSKPCYLLETLLTTTSRYHLQTRLPHSDVTATSRLCFRLQTLLTTSKTLLTTFRRDYHLQT
jgi:hypothetical protein